MNDKFSIHGKYQKVIQEIQEKLRLKIYSYF